MGKIKGGCGTAHDPFLCRAAYIVFACAAV